MKKIIFLFMMLPFVMEAQDFTYNGVVYTIIDEVNKYCETKQGFREEIRDPYLHYKYTSGNQTSGSLVIPEVAFCDEIEYKVVSLGAYSFYANEMTSLSLPSSLKSIRYNALSECRNLNELIIPPSVENMDLLCFSHYIEKIAIPNCLSSNIGRNAKYFISYPSDDAIVIDGVLYSSNQDCVYYIPMTIERFNIPNSVERIGELAFAGCSNIDKISINDKIKYIGEGAFRDCTSLLDISLPKSISEVENSLFANCSSLRNVKMDSNLKSISTAAFSGCCELVEIEIPNSVSKIKYGAFLNCVKLEKVVIPNGIKEFGNDVFSGCNSLKTIIYSSDNPIMTSQWIFPSSVYQNADLIIPSGCFDNYISTIPWKMFDNIVEREDTGIDQLTNSISNRIYDFNGISYSNTAIPSFHIVIAKENNHYKKRLMRQNN